MCVSNGHLCLVADWATGVAEKFDWRGIPLTLILHLISISITPYAIPSTLELEVVQLRRWKEQNASAPLPTAVSQELAKLREEIERSKQETQAAQETNANTQLAISAMEMEMQALQRDVDRRDQEIVRLKAKARTLEDELDDLAKRRRR